MVRKINIKQILDVGKHMSKKIITNDRTEREEGREGGREGGGTDLSSEREV